MTTQAPPWHEEEAFWDAWAPYGFDAQRIEAANGEVDQIADRLQIPAGAAVLDLCCGIGRHSVKLARREYRVTGVDRNPRHLRLARQAAQQAGVDLELVEADMRLFRRRGAFDAAVNLWTSFGYFDDEAEDRKVLENLFASLKRGGRLLMEMAGKEVVARVFQPRQWEEHGEVIVCQETKIVDAWRFVESRLLFFHAGQRREFTIKTRCFSAVELSDLLAGCGFVEIEVFGDLAGAPYDHQAKRLVVIARRPSP